MKKALSAILALAMALSAFTMTVSALDAAPTASTVLVNGDDVAFDAYNIEGNNYFKLRDIAFTLNGTEKQFSVGWDGAANAISLTSGQPYEPAGGEMESKGSGTKAPTPTKSKILLDGKEVSLTAYNIDGNNYFKLRDIGAAFDFGVDWDGTKNTIVIDTGKGYTEPEAPAAPPSGTDTSGGDGPPVKISYSAEELAKIKADNEALIQNEPVNGKPITFSELQALKAPYIKGEGSGNTSYTKYMTGMFEKKDAKWVTSQSMSISDNWRKVNGLPSKYEKLFVKDSSEKAGAVKCGISTEDDKFYYDYEWYKTAKEGIVRKTPKTSTPSVPGGYGSDHYDPAKMPEIKVMLYPDAKVAGQDCIVYSFAMPEMPEGFGMYFWFSKTKGFDILQETFMSMPSVPDLSGIDFDNLDPENMPDLSAMFDQPAENVVTVNATFYYEVKRVDKDNSFFDPGKQDVEAWVEK